MKNDTGYTKLMKSSDGGTIVEMIAKVHTMTAITVIAYIRCVAAYSADVSNTNCMLATYWSLIGFYAKAFFLLRVHKT